MKARFPSIRDVAHDLAAEWRDVRRSFSKAELDDGDGNSCVDVRLQVLDTGEWCLHTGSSDYDTDHHGYWGASILNYGRQNMRELAKDLIEQARDDEAFS